MHVFFIFSRRKNIYPCSIFLLLGNVFIYFPFVLDHALMQVLDNLPLISQAGPMAFRIWRASRQPFITHCFSKAYLCNDTIYRLANRQSDPTCCTIKECKNAFKTLSNNVALKYIFTYLRNRSERLVLYF